MMPTPDVEIAYGRETQSSRVRWLRRWAFRIGITVAALAAVVVLAHAVWLGVATWRLNRAIADLAAAGEPISPAAFPATTVPAAQNGFTDLINAGLSMGVSTPASRRRDSVPGLPESPLTPLERERLSARLTELPIELDKLDRALAMPYCVAPGSIATPGTLPPYMTRTDAERRAFWIVTDAAVLNHDAGRHGEAVRRLLQLGHIARASASSPTYLDSILGVDFLGTQAITILSMAPTLRIGDGPVGAPPLAVRALIDSLLDTQTSETQMITGVRGERARAIAVYQTHPFDAVVPAGAGWLPRVARAVIGYAMRPVVKTAELHCVRIFTASADAYAASDWPAADAKINPHVTDSPMRLTRLVGTSALGTPPVGRWLFLAFTHRTNRALAATALAVRWFEADHGRLPVSLAELVPAYLPAVPLDPMAAGGTPLRADFTGPDPRLWSVGTNGTDDNGRDEPEATAVRNPYVSGTPSYDRVHHIKPQPRVIEEMTKQLNAIDPDGTIATDIPATPPLGSTLLSADTVSLPDWDEPHGFTARGYASLASGRPPFGFTNRGQLLSMLADSIIDPAPLVATPPHTDRLCGTVTFDTGVWQFELSSPTTGRLRAPTGETIPIRRLPPNSPAKRSRFWE